MLGYHTAGDFFLPRRGLDLYVQKIPVGKAKARDVRKQGQRFACVQAFVPTAGIKRCELAPGMVATGGAAGDREGRRVEVSIQ